MQKLKAYIPDIFIIAGIAAVFYGLFSIYKPLAWIYIGVIFLWVGLPGKRDGGS